MNPHMVAEDMVIQASAAALSVVVVVSDLQVEAIENTIGNLGMTTTINPPQVTTIVTTIITTTTTMARTTIDITTKGILMGPIIRMNLIRNIIAV